MRILRISFSANVFRWFLLPVLSGLIGTATLAQEENQSRSEDDIISRMTRAEVLLVATLKNIQPTVQSQSIPPTTTYILTFGNDRKQLRSTSSTVPERGKYQHTKGRPGKPVQGQRFLLLGRFTGPPDQKGNSDQNKKEKKPNRNIGGRPTIPGGNVSFKVNLCVPVTKNRLAAAKKIAGFHPGWSLDDQDQPRSPWTRQNVGWPDPEQDEFETEVRDGKTGRPMGTVPDGIRISVQPVVPEDAKKYVNPDGDGKFRIIVKNETKKELRAPAIVASEEKVRWRQSIFLISQGRTHLLPGTESPRLPLHPASLEAGEKISTVIDLLPLETVDWPGGAWNVNFTFCIGDRCKKSTFYYKSDYHDALR